MSTAPVRASNYIGYASLEAWEAAIDSSRPVYASKVVDESEGERGLRTQYLRLMVAQPDAAGDVHYFRMTVANVTWLLDQPISRDSERRIELHDEAWRHVQAWLKAADLHWHEAVVATPPPDRLRLLDGWPEFLKYDKQAQLFWTQEA
ncbi:MAG: hypothetical protein IT318_24885 [Anaerolineales bacterium]|nr:hypothetical protein [Anaerolineales bacterium]